jgi:D-alanine-D-alanine ligase
MARIRLGIIFGGRSSEHEVSLRSARSVLEALDRRRYDPVLIGIDLEGCWHLCSEAEFERLTGSTALGRLLGGSDEVALPPSPKHGELLALETGRQAIPHLDVVFPVLHGQYGEDGTMQGLLELADIPYVGSGVLGSALGMDKDVQKRLLHLAGLPVVEYVAVRDRDWREQPDTIRQRAAEMPYPLFVKPASLGSSVGVSKVRSDAHLDAAIEAALGFDEKVLVERGVDAREIECAVLGNETPQVSVPGEVCPTEDFYSYEAKYVNEHGATFVIPAALPPDQADRIRQMAAAAFEVIECSGMARVDFFLERDSDRVFVNELNTIPGFTSISQYPKLWEASGLPYRELLDRLVSLAIERHGRRRRLRTTLP